MNTVATKPDTKAKPEVKGKAVDSTQPATVVDIKPEDAKQDAVQSEVEHLVSTKTEAELFAIYQAVQKVVESKQSTKKADAVKQIEAIAKDAGLDVTIKGFKKPNPNAKTYRNPNNASETFVMDGIAKRPDWLKELLKAGRKLREFEVKVEQTKQAA